MEWSLGGCQAVCACEMCVAGHAMNLGKCITHMHTHTPSVLALSDFWFVTSICLCYGVALKFCSVSILQLLCLMAYSRVNVYD